jgi:nucleoside-diphosphate-sugar epimerase
MEEFQMKRALVLGASGGMGYAIVKELSSRGIAVTAFARTESKLQKLFKEDANVTIATGNLLNLEDIEAAAEGSDIIFHAANIPYPEWEEKLAPMMNNVLSVAKDKSLKFAMVDNIYAYGRSSGGLVSETTPKVPHTKKGKIRLQLHQIVKESGVPAFIAHFPDFYGPNAENTLLNVTLKSVIQNKMAGIVGDKRIPREFIFTPDGAKAIVNLAMNDEAYGQIWNIPGPGLITGNELIQILRDLTHYEKPVYTISKGTIRFMGLFTPMMREVVEMFYLNEEPVILSGEKYEKHIGPLPKTSYEEGLKKTLEYMKLALPSG